MYIYIYIYTNIWILCNSKNLQMKKRCLTSLSWRFPLLKHTRPSTFRWGEQFRYNCSGQSSVAKRLLMEEILHHVGYIYIYIWIYIYIHKTLYTPVLQIVYNKSWNYICQLLQEKNTFFCFHETCPSVLAGIDAIISSKILGHCQGFLTDVDLGGGQWRFKDFLFHQTFPKSLAKIPKTTLKKAQSPKTKRIHGTNGFSTYVFFTIKIPPIMQEATLENFPRGI